MKLAVTHVTEVTLTLTADEAELLRVALGTEVPAVTSQFKDKMEEFRWELSGRLRAARTAR